MENSNDKKTELILSGDPAKDFPAFLKSKDKPFEKGMELIQQHTRNTSLYKFLRGLIKTDEKRAKSMLLFNLKIIGQKWSKK